MIKDGILQDANVLSDKDLVEALKSFRDKLNALKVENEELSKKYLSLMDDYTSLSQKATKLSEINVDLIEENQRYKQKRFYRKRVKS